MVTVRFSKSMSAQLSASNQFRPACANGKSNANELLPTGVGGSAQERIGLRQLERLRLGLGNRKRIDRFADVAGGKFHLSVTSRPDP